MCDKEISLHSDMDFITISSTSEITVERLQREYYKCLISPFILTGSCLPTGRQ